MLGGDVLVRDLGVAHPVGVLRPAAAPAAGAPPGPGGGARRRLVLGVGAAAHHAEVVEEGVARVLELAPPLLPSLVGSPVPGLQEPARLVDGLAIDDERGLLLLAPRGRRRPLDGVRAPGGGGVAVFVGLRDEVWDRGGGGGRRRLRLGRCRRRHGGLLRPGAAEVGAASHARRGLAVGRRRRRSGVGLRRGRGGAAPVAGLVLLVDGRDVHGGMAGPLAHAAEGGGPAGSAGGGGGAAAVRGGGAHHDAARRDSPAAPPVLRPGRPGPGARPRPAAAASATLPAGEALPPTSAAAAAGAALRLPRLLLLLPPSAAGAGPLRERGRAGMRGRRLPGGCLPLLVLDRP